MSFLLISPDRAQHGAVYGPLHSIGTALTRAWLAFLKRRAHRQACADLHAMSDRELWDIGLSRSEIEAAVRGPDPQVPNHLRGRHY